MSDRLRRLLDPSHTAVVTVELQRGVCGDLATMTALRDAVDAAGLVGRVQSLLSAARGAGAIVLHATFELAADRTGTSLRSPLIVALARNPEHLLVGSGATELLAGLGRDSDVLVPRRTGWTAFAGGRLHDELQARGVETVVLCGVTTNLGVVGSAITAADLGYHVVVVRDAVVGLPADFGDAVVANTLAPIAHVVNVDDVVACWSPPSEA